MHPPVRQKPCTSLGGHEFGSPSPRLQGWNIPGNKHTHMYPRAKNTYARERERETTYTDIAVSFNVVHPKTGYRTSFPKKFLYSF